MDCGGCGGCWLVRTSTYVCKCKMFELHRFFARHMYCWAATELHLLLPAQSSNLRIWCTHHACVRTHVSGMPPLLPFQGCCDCVDIERYIVTGHSGLEPAAVVSGREMCHENVVGEWSANSTQHAVQLNYYDDSIFVLHLRRCGMWGQSEHSAASMATSPLSPPADSFLPSPTALHP